MGRPRNFLKWLAYWPYTTFLEDLVLCGIVFGTSALISLVPPSCRDWVAGDPTLNHPFAVHEAVPNSLLVVLCLVVPMVTLPVIRLLQFRSSGVYIAAITLLQALSWAALITNAIKVFEGRLRPDWFDRLRRLGYSTDPDGWQALCKVRQLRDGRLSFPSGHSSLMFAACGVLCLQLMAFTHVLVPCSRRCWKIVLCLSPFILSAWVACTRTLDYRHNFDDISVGSAIGLCCAVLFHHFYFPPLWQPNCEYPVPRNPLQDPPPDQPTLGGAITPPMGGTPTFGLTTGTGPRWGPGAATVDV